MADRRKKILKNLLKNNPTETEQRLLNLVLERICADMADFYQKFFAVEGPGAIVYAPGSEENSMFYLNTQELISAIDDFSSRDMDELANTMRKAVAKAESINPDKEALFIIQDPAYLSLIHYNRDDAISVADS